MAPRALLSSRPRSTAPSQTKCTEQTSVNRVLRAVKRDTKGEPDDALEDLESENDNKRQVDETGDNENSIGYPCASLVTNSDLQETRSSKCTAKNMDGSYHRTQNDQQDRTDNPQHAKQKADQAHMRSFTPRKPNTRCECRGDLDHKDNDRLGSTAFLAGTDHRSCSGLIQAK